MLRLALAALFVVCLAVASLSSLVGAARLATPPHLSASKDSTLFRQLVRMGGGKNATRPLRAAPGTRFLSAAELQAQPIVASDPVTCPQTATTVALNVPPRKMWGWGPGISGYCGETCFQASLATYGAWISAEWVRYADGDAELLIGVNDEKAAKGLNLEYEVYSGFKTTADDYLKDFVKPQIQSGAPVTMGFYELLKSGDRDYDHIMIIFGIDLDASGKVVGIRYNDWWSKTESRHLCRYTSGTTKNPHFIATRTGCNSASNPESQPYDYCIPSGSQYAIALTGLTIKSPDGVSTYLQATEAWEPDWGKEDGLHQTPVLQTFNLQLTGTKAGTSYTVLRFDGPQAFATAGSNPKTGSWAWSQVVAGAPDANGQQWVNGLQLMSDGQFYFVTVKT